MTTLGIGSFYVLLIYAGVVGFGLTQHGLEALQNNGAPFSALAERFVGTWLGTLATIAVMTSFVSLNIVTVNAGSRMIYSLGRDAVLPRWFDHVNLRKSPDRSALSVGLVGIVLTLVVGSTNTPANTAEWASYLATLFFIVAYAIADDIGRSSHTSGTSQCRLRRS